jgi:hypothetical protein
MLGTMAFKSKQADGASASFITSRLRLFLSVGIIGSTAFKQSALNNQFDDVAQPWLIPIAKFYREFDSNLFAEWRRYIKHGLPSGQPLSLWKAIGDELVYTKIIKNPREVIGTIQVWRNVVHKYRNIFYENNLPLDLKTTAWLAGFPYTNAEIAFSINEPRNFASAESEDVSAIDAVYENLKLLNEYYGEGRGEKIILDFIGPSIDTGFRLASLSTRRKMVVSVDLAYMIACEIEWWRQRDLADYFSLEFRYDGRHAFKGVMGGKLYPIFWIDNTPHRSFVLISKDDELDHAEDDLLLNTRWTAS